MQTDILVVDDEQVIVDSVKKLCSAEGWKVDTVLDAKDGLRRIDQQQYRLIVCDIMMPEMDGFQFLDELKKRQVKTPVIITTGYSTVENAVKSLNTGAIDFLAKPFTFDELISSIKRGFRLADILNTSDANGTRDDEHVSFVPCPANYKRLGYSSWAFLEDDGSVKVGVTDLLLRTIDGIEAFDLSEKDDEIIQGNPCMQIVTSDQLQHVILAPMTGRVVEKNERIAGEKDLIEKDPYFTGWIYRIIPSSVEYEMKHLTPCSVDF